MAVNKVILGNETLIDLTQDTVQANKLASGLTAHDCSGSIITGTLALESTLVASGTHIVVPPNSTWNHIDIYGISGGVTGKNLFNVSTCTPGYYINVSGVITTDNNPSMYTELIPVTPNTVYTFSGVCGFKGNKRIHGYNDSGTWVKQITYINQNTVAVGTNMEISFTIPANVRNLRISCSSPDTNLQLEQSSSKTAYEKFGTISLEVDSFSGDVKSIIPIELNNYTLDNSGYSPNLISIDTSGNVSFTEYSENTYQVYELDPITIPSISTRDRIYVKASTPPPIQYTYTIEGTEAVIPEGSLTIFENGTYDISTYASVTVSV